MPEEKKNEKREVSRRDFLVGAGAVVVSGVGAGILAGCGQTTTVTQTVSVTNTKTITSTATTTVQGGATTVTATTTKTVGAGETATITQTVTGPTKTVTTTATGGGGVVPALEPETTVTKTFSLAGGVKGGEFSNIDSKNGKAVRVRPVHYDEKYAKADMKQWTFTTKGKTLEPLMKSLPNYFSFAYKNRMYSPNRVKYPLQRVDWEPGGDPAKINPQNRGKSKFKRISWEQAATIVANEVNRIQDKYSPYSVLCMGDGHAECKNISQGHAVQMFLLGLHKGYTQQRRNADSWEGWTWGAAHVWGQGSAGLANPKAGTFINAGPVIWDTMKNSDMMITTGGDWETTTQGFSGHYLGKVLYFMDTIGLKKVFVSPELNYAAAVHADKWIPVLPNTDPALQLAIMHTWISEGTYDKDYVATHVVGFDKFQAYVMGTSDGIPKNPKWASPKCGVPVWTIKALARQWAKGKTSTAHYYGSPMARGPYSTEPARLECCQLGMQGLGKPGVNQVYYGGGEPKNVIDPSLSRGRPSGRNTYVVKSIFPRTMSHHAILNPPITHWGNTSAGMTREDHFVKYTWPNADTGNVDIHMIWNDNSCQLTCWNGGYYMIRAFRSPKIECIVGEHQWLENDSLFADIVLPVTTKFEEEDIIMTGPVDAAAQVHIVVREGLAQLPIGESKTDWDVCAEVAKKLGPGVYDKFTGGKTYQEWMKYAFDNSGLPTYLSWDTLSANRFWPIPVIPDWEKEPAGMIGFYTDPVKNPLGTPSGKLEFYSQAIADNFPGDNEMPPNPQWVQGGTDMTHDEHVGGPRSKSYPLYLETNHPRWRHHAQGDDMAWLREIPTCKQKGPDGYAYEPVWINPVTAAPRGIQSGDIVKIFNDRGTVLGIATVWERVLPGMVYQDHGARVDLITDGMDLGGTNKLIDRGGANNLICSEKGLSMHCWGMPESGYLVECLKVTPEEMNGWRAKYPEAFARDYNPDFGPTYDSWVLPG